MTQGKYIYSAENSIYFERTYKAYLAVRKLRNKSKTQLAPCEFGWVAEEILRLDPMYDRWQDDFRNKHNLTETEARVVIELIAKEIYEGDSSKNISSGENEIKKYLIDKNYRFEREKTFEGLISESALRFDFFLTDLNTVIEYNGIQHYQPVDWFGGVAGFEGTVKRDEIKRNWCRRSGIRMIEIRYDESVKEILEGVFNG